MISARRCQATMLCHSVRSCHSPALSLKRSLVAMLNLATAVPLGVYLTSGSFPRFPTRITLLTLFAMRDFVLFSSAPKALIVFRRRSSLVHPQHFHVHNSNPSGISQK